MAHHARYTTFRSGELEAQIRALGGSLGCPHGIPNTHANKSRLLKAHACTVHYPDGTTGICRYERGGPAWHQFRYECASESGSELLPQQYWSKPLGNDVVSIEAKSQELVEAAFNEAIIREQQAHFMRASEGVSRRKQPALFGMTAAKAKRLAGRYALCRRVGTALVPLGPTYTRLEDANEAWRVQAERDLVVACCNRLDRCWQPPRFNPLHADPAYRAADTNGRLPTQALSAEKGT